MRWYRPLRAGTARERSPVLMLSVKKSIRISGRRREEMVSGCWRRLRRDLRCVWFMGLLMRFVMLLAEVVPSLAFFAFGILATCLSRYCSCPAHSDCGLRFGMSAALRRSFDFLITSWRNGKCTVRARASISSTASPNRCLELSPVPTSF